MPNRSSSWDWDPHPINDGHQAGRDGALRRLGKPSIADMRAARVDYGREFPNAQWEEAFWVGAAELVREMGWPHGPSFDVSGASSVPGDPSSMR